jgi:hypothetical protein
MDAVQREKIIGDYEQDQNAKSKPCAGMSVKRRCRWAVERIESGNDSDNNADGQGDSRIKRTDGR